MSTFQNTLTEDNIYFMEFVYELAISKGYNTIDAVNLSEMALFKKQNENIRYSSLDEAKLRDLFNRKHH